MWVVRGDSEMIGAKASSVGRASCSLTAYCLSVAGGFLRDGPTCGDLPGGPRGEGAAGQHYALCRAVHEKLGPREGIRWGCGSICLVMLSAAAGRGVVWSETWVVSAAL